MSEEDKSSAQKPGQPQGTERMRVDEIHGSESTMRLRKGVSDGQSQLREGYKSGKPEGVSRPKTYPIPPQAPAPTSASNTGGNKDKT